MRYNFFAALLGILSLTPAIAGTPEKLSISYQKTGNQFVIALPEARVFPEQNTNKSSASVKLTNNVHIDASLLGRAQARFTPKAPSSFHTVKVAAAAAAPAASFHTAPCHAGLDNEGMDYVVCFDRSQTQLSENDAVDLRAFVENEGYYLITTYAHSPGEDNQRIAEQRTDAILGLLKNAGINNDWVMSEEDVEDGCQRNCMNQTVVAFQPFK